MRDKDRVGHLFWEHSPLGQVSLKMRSPGLVFTCPSVYSFELRAAFGFFLSFSLQQLSELRQNTSTFCQGITSHFQIYHRNMHWSKTILLQRCLARRIPRVITSFTVKPDVLLIGTLQTSAGTLVIWSTVCVEQVATYTSKLLVSFGTSWQELDEIFRYFNILKTGLRVSL